MMRMQGWQMVAAALVAALLPAAGAGAPVAAADEGWPQWRGPLATGAAPEADPPVEWSETRNVRWKLAIPGERVGDADRLG